MRIKIQQFLFGKSHSWAIVGQNIGRALIKLGHDVDFISTDGFKDKYCPDDLRQYVKLSSVNEKDIAKEALKLGEYDCQISYTAPHNWPIYLANGKKNRFGIWNYEYNNKSSSGKNLLQGFAKYYKYLDLVFPSSTFSKEVFLSMGVPEDRMKVVPHGINLDDFKSKNPFVLKTNKKRKILLNIAQPHRRKALPLALKSFGEAFNINDDVVLVAKVFKNNFAGHQFDVDFDKIFQTFERKYPKHAEVKLVYDYIPNIADIYSACDINFSATYAECWHLPSLEALASGIINVVPRYGGQLDFCNDNNSLLVNGKVVRAPRDHQYWSFNPYAVHYEISISDCVEKLREANNNYNSLLTKFQDNMKETVKKFTWENAALDILQFCN